MTKNYTIYSISQITALIRNNLEASFQDLWLEGEISNLKTPSSGHIYFVLKDSTSQIRAVSFRFKNRFFTFQPQDGMKVLVRGRISVYEARGEYQILVDQIEPRGTGALQIAFEQLKAKLLAEGLFAPEAKKPIPPYPQTIGIVTSPTGAAIHDMLKVIHRRFANVSIIINPVRVQGEEAPAEIARAIYEFNQLPHIDVLIVGRGGGSIEDLWAFNEEIVARAIFKSQLPVISAVGHEIDFTIADFVADLRAPTPSAAAELVVKDKQNLLDQILGTQKKLYQIAQHKMELLSHRLEKYSQSRVLLHPERFIQGYQQSVDNLELRLQQATVYKFSRKKEKTQYLIDTIYRLTPLALIHNYQQKIINIQEKLYQQKQGDLKDQRARLYMLAGKLDTLSPLAVLKRGYSICRKLPHLQIITDAKNLGPRDLINIKLFHGEIIAEVKSHARNEI